MGCPHGRQSWRSCPHCLGVNNPPVVIPPVVSEASLNVAPEAGALACPKCGSMNTWMCFEPEQHSRFDNGFRNSHGLWCGEGEHFDRGCRRCQYGWFTEDVLKEETSDGKRTR